MSSVRCWSFKNLSQRRRSTHLYAWYKIFRRTRKHSLSFLIPTRMRRHVCSFHHVVEVVDWHFRADDVSSKRRLSLPIFFCLQRRETRETSLHDVWTFRRVARTASFRPWSCRCHARGLENMFHPFFRSHRRERLAELKFGELLRGRLREWQRCERAVCHTIQCFLSGENDDQQGTGNSRSFNLFGNEETSHKDWNPFKTAGENVSSTTKWQVSGIRRERLNELCQSKKKLLLSKLFLRTVFKNCF